MENGADIEFLAACIKNLETALLINESDNTCRIPNAIIKAVGIEDNGNLIGVLPNLPVSDDDLLNYLPASLQFYKKGAKCYLKLMGRCRIIKYDQEPDYYKYLLSQTSLLPSRKYMLLVFSSQKVYYQEERVKPFSIFENIVTFIYHCFKLNPPHYRKKFTHSVFYKLA